MFRVGDKVAPFFDMGKEGVVIEVKKVTTRTWLVGGAASHSFRIIVRFEDNSTVDYQPNDLMPLK